MKSVINIVLLTGSLIFYANIFFAQESPYAEFERNLISVWFSGSNACDRQLEYSTQELLNSWKELSQITNHTDEVTHHTCLYRYEIENLLIELGDNKDQLRYSEINRTTHSIFYTLANLRQCKGEYLYHLDLLWNSYVQFIEINTAVNDVMFNKLEWFEFMDIVNCLEESWNDFKDLGPEIIVFQCPTVPIDVLSQKMNQFDNCFEVFKRAFNGSYYSEFIEPCDDMGQALLDMILLFGDQRIITQVTNYSQLTY